MSEGAIIKLDKTTIALLTRALTTEYRRLQLELRITEERIRKFEEKYGMTSEEFKKKYMHGELGDDEDFMKWYGELVFLENIRRELKELKKIADKISGSIPSQG